jgi:hypothetical protein
MMGNLEWTFEDGGTYEIGDIVGNEKIFEDVSN